jgi:methionine aminopeptidase
MDNKEKERVEKIEKEIQKELKKRATAEEKENAKMKKKGYNYVITFVRHGIGDDIRRRAFTQVLLSDAEITKRLKTDHFRIDEI